MVPSTRLRQPERCALSLRDQWLDPAVPWPSTVANEGIPVGATEWHTLFPTPTVFDDPNMRHIVGRMNLVTTQYQRFISKAEAYYCEAFRIPEAHQQHYKGRGLPVRTRVLPMGKPTPMETCYAHPLANTYDSLSHRLKDIALSGETGRRSVQQHQIQRAAIIDHVCTQAVKLQWHPTLGPQQDHAQLLRHKRHTN